MKTEQQLARIALELNAIDATYSKLRYLQISPKNNSWSYYCKFVSYNISQFLYENEYMQKYNPARF